MDDAVDRHADLPEDQNIFSVTDLPDPDPAPGDPSENPVADDAIGRHEDPPPDSNVDRDLAPTGLPRRKLIRSANPFISCGTVFSIGPQDFLWLAVAAAIM
jgi:hypothetical protein